MPFFSVNIRFFAKDSVFSSDNISIQDVRSVIIRQRRGQELLLSTKRCNASAFDS